MRTELVPWLNNGMVRFRKYTALSKCLVNLPQPISMGSSMR